MDTVWFSKLFGKSENSLRANENKSKTPLQGCFVFLVGRIDISGKPFLL